MLSLAEIMKEWNIQWELLTMTVIKENVYEVVSDQFQHVLKRKNCSKFWSEEFSVLKQLENKGVPVSLPIKTRIGKSYVQDDEWIYVLYPKVKGFHNVNHGKAELSNHLFNEYGKVLAQLHRALQPIELSTMPPGNWNMIGQIRAWVQQGIPEKLSSIITPYIQLVLDYYDSLPTHLIHRDFHPKNLLVHHKKVSCILDFDEMKIGPRVYDICYFIVAIVREAILWKETITMSLRNIHIFLKQYERELPLTAIERKLVPALIIILLVLYSRFYHEQGFIELAQAYERTILEGSIRTLFLEDRLFAFHL